MTVLATTDFSDDSGTALRAAAKLAARRDVPLRVLYCDEGFAEDATWRFFVQTPWEEPKNRKKQMRKRLSDFVDRTLTDVPTSLDIRQSVLFDHVEDTIVDATDDGDVELVVAGATGASDLTEAVLGSTAEKIVRVSAAPVLVVPPDTEWEPIEEILAPVDLSEPSRMSLDLAVDLARDYGARLHILRAIDIPATSVVPYQPESPPVDMQDYEAKMADALDEFIADAEVGDLEVTTSLPLDTPHAAIVEAAEDRASDLVVMGTHGRRGLGRLLLGSTAAKVLRRLPAPVMTFRPTA